LEKLIIPTAAAKAKMPDVVTSEIYTQVLKERELKLNMFNNLKIRTAYFKSTERAALVKPQNLSFESSKDEFNQGKQKLTLKFILPRGCYATMLIKRLFADPL